MSKAASPAAAKTATVVQVRESLVLIEVDEQTPVMKNEVGYVRVGDERLKAEVLRIRGRTADMQVFEDTSGVRVGDQVEMTGEMLSATLGPGLLGHVFDGLQNPLAVLAEQHGFFLPRGVGVSPLDLDRKWSFTPQASVGDRVAPGGVLGTVPEGPFTHKILVPFGEPEPVEVSWIGEGDLTLVEPVAAREASIYMGVTLAEYYRQMGLNVLLIADSTSRWAQAMRETSGRMEEIPGEEAFPAYLDSSIKSVYERAGVIRCADESQGSLTMIGTVSPAGGNFEEPVTQSTLGTVKTFLGLSYDRAYKRFYPAIDPLLSWSRYLDQLNPWLAENLDANWTRDVQRFRELLEQGDSINQMMQVTGEKGITLEDFVIWQKSLLLDMGYLQQDAFDQTDACMPRARQFESLQLMKHLIDREYTFQDRDEARIFFTKVIGLYKNWNYSPPESPEYEKYKHEIEEAAREQQ